MRFIFLLLYLSILCPPGVMHGEELQSILARMDKESTTFKGMSADVKMVAFTAILDTTDTQSGTVKMQRSKSGDARAVMDFSKSGGQVIAFLGKIIRVYYPELKSYQDYEVGKNNQEVNQYLLLGFGSSGKELAKSYSITPEGTEKVAGIEATKLLLTPNGAKVRERLTKVEIWIPVGRASPIQQQFYEPSGNSRKTTYSNLTINPPLPGNLDFKLPSGAQKQS